MFPSQKNQNSTYRRICALWEGNGIFGTNMTLVPRGVKTNNDSENGDIPLNTSISMNSEL